MNYYFTDLFFSISVQDLFSMGKYKDFYTDSNKEPDCTITIMETSNLKLPELNPVFKTEHGIKIYQNGDTEYRCFSDCFSGDIYALLEDRGDTKQLWIQSNRIPNNRTEMNLLNCLALEKTMNKLGRLILHASFIETPDGAILFTAPSGTGKSTQAFLWEQHCNMEIINGDRAGIWKSDNVWMAGGVPWCGTSGITKNKTMSLLAIVILEQGTDNTITELPTIMKLRYLLEQTTINPWDSVMLRNSQELLLQLCSQVKVLHFSCTPNEDAVKVLRKELGI